MPACRDCEWFRGDVPVAYCELAGRTHKREIRSCHIALLLQYQAQFYGHVLEVGCGINRMACRVIRRAGAEWTGLDARFQYDKPRRSFYVPPVDKDRLVSGNVKDLPFGSFAFDWVVSLASIEHWRERGCTEEQGLRECYRVLKPGGHLLVDNVFHVHGSDQFYFGDVEEVKALYWQLPWAELKFEEWRKDYEPMQPIYEWDTPYNSDEKRQRMRELFPDEQPSKWSLVVHARK